MQVKILKDSISAHTGVRLTTFELEYPRFIHSELMTHRMLSKNAASSRAIPVDKCIEQVTENLAMPVYWGANKAGMQAKEEVQDIENAQNIWKISAHHAVQSAINLKNAGLHKQIVNRVIEPFVNIKVVLTGTDFNNLFWLRYHEDAQPEFFELAKLMRHEMDHSQPVRLTNGEWHLPYIDTSFGADGEQHYFVNGEQLTLEQAKKISVSCCAQVSYRKNDVSLEKALDIYDRLISSSPIHASPTEHQGTPMKSNADFHTTGLTAKHKNGSNYSGNLREWIQLRQLIPNNVKVG